MGNGALSTMPEARATATLAEVLPAFARSTVAEYLGVAGGRVVGMVVHPEEILEGWVWPLGAHSEAGYFGTASCSHCGLISGLWTEAQPPNGVDGYDGGRFEGGQWRNFSALCCSQHCADKYTRYTEERERRPDLLDRVKYCVSAVVFMPAVC